MKAVIRNGELRTVYQDRWFPLLKLLGKVQITRATNVEWEGDAWVARLSSGDEIARGPERQRVISMEIEYLEERL